MSSWHSYPSIYALGHAVLRELFSDEVLIEEKVDGSQFSFGIIDGVLRAKSKGKELVIDAPEKMFGQAVYEIQQLPLKEGWTYRGEVLSKPKHNVLCYSRIPKHTIILFDVNTEEEQYLSRTGKEQEAERIGLEIVPVLHTGTVHDSNQLSSFLERESILGGTKIEGVVIKNYHRFGPDKKVLMGKYVSEAFKEKHNKEWKANNPANKDVIALLVATLKTNARWNKAIQHLSERGELTNTPKDIGALIKEVQADIFKEEEDFIKEKLYAHAKDHIKRGCVAGLPEWYKQKLLESQFDGGETT